MTRKKKREPRPSTPVVVRFNADHTATRVDVPEKRPRRRPRSYYEAW